MKIDFNLNTILIGALIVLVILFKFQCGSDSDTTKARIAGKDSLIAEKQRRIDDIKEENTGYERVILSFERRDSLFTEYFKTRPQVYKKLDDQLKNIPIRISAIANNNDSIHAILAK